MSSIIWHERFSGAFSARLLIKAFTVAIEVYDTHAIKNAVSLAVARHIER